MPDVMELSAKHRNYLRRASQQAYDYERWRRRAWMAIKELIWLHKQGR
jgi:hypothetical protein